MRRLQGLPCTFERKKKSEILRLRSAIRAQYGPEGADFEIQGQPRKGWRLTVTYTPDRAERARINRKLKGEATVPSVEQAVVLASLYGGHRVPAKTRGARELLNLGLVRDTPEGLELTREGFRLIHRVFS